MTPAGFREAVEDARRTQLDRLGSPRLLVSLAGGDPSATATLRAAAHSERAARETFRTWAADESDPDAAAAFEATVDREDEHLARVLDALDEDVAVAGEPGPMHAYLRGRDETVHRVAGGMVGRCLVSTRTHARVVAFFEDRGDDRRVDLFRDLRAETEDTLETGLRLLGSRCESDEDWREAGMVAEYVVQLVYDDYADGLAEAGLDPESER